MQLYIIRHMLDFYIIGELIHTITLLCGWARKKKTKEMIRYIMHCIYTKMMATNNIYLFLCEYLIDICYIFNMCCVSKWRILTLIIYTRMEFSRDSHLTLKLHGTAKPTNIWWWEKGRMFCIYLIQIWYIYL